MLEIRVSFETKEALRRKSLSENRSVSGIVRDLINQYLTDESISTPNLGYKERVIMLKSFLLSKPKTAFAGLGVAFIGLLSFGSLAFAGELNLDFEGEFIKHGEDGEKHVKRVNYEMVGKDTDNFTVKFELADRELFIEIRAYETLLANNEDGVMLAFELKENKDGEEVVLAMPQLSAIYGEEAAVKIEKGDGFSYSWKVRPTLGD
jgi:hypothetical protein